MELPRESCKEQIRIMASNSCRYIRYCPWIYWVRDYLVGGVSNVPYCLFLLALAEQTSVINVAIVQRTQFYTYKSLATVLLDHVI